MYLTFQENQRTNELPWNRHTLGHDRSIVVEDGELTVRQFGLQFAELLSGQTLVGVTKNRYFESYFLLDFTQIGVR